jgi:hypothetical protein
MTKPSAPPVTAASSAADEEDEAVVQWFVFFSEKYQREYYFEPKSKTTTWIMPDDMHPYPSSPITSIRTSNNDAKNVKTKSTRRVSFYDPVSTDTSPPRPRGVLLAEDFQEVVKPRKRSMFSWGWILVVGLVLVISVTLVALLRAGIAFDGITMLNSTVLAQSSEQSMQSDSHMDILTTEKQISDPLEGNFDCYCACNDTTSTFNTEMSTTLNQRNSVDEEANESTVRNSSHKRGGFPLTLVICRDCSRLLAQNGQLLATFNNLSIVRYDPFR